MPVVVHFGPSHRDSGGMARVIQCYVESDLAPWRVEAVSTYSAGSRIRQLGHVARALSVLGLRPRRRMCGIHVHASQRFDLLRTALLLRVARLRRIPAIVTIHGADFMDEVRERPHRVARMLRHADAVTALSEEVEEAVRGFGVTNVSILPNPVQVRPLPARGDAGGSVVLFAGEIGHRKGVDVLLRAWPTVTAAHPDASLVLAGPPVEPELLRLLPAGASYAGVLSRAQMLEAIGRARLAVLPSRAEAMPMFILEAMSAGVPVVGTSVGAVPWLLGRGGVVVPPGDSEALAAAIAGLLSDPALSVALSTAARDRVVAEFAPDAFVRRVSELYAGTFGRASVLDGADANGGPRGSAPADGADGSQSS
jgi:glycosyltransferase involved in cell wall biosynthesis